MQIRPNAEFKSTLPYDGVEAGNGFVQWPGKNVAEAIEDVLTAVGCVVGGIEDLNFKGWELDFAYRRVTLLCRVSMIDDYIVSFYDPSFFRGLFKARHPDFVPFLRAISDALSKDPRFVDVRWYSQDDVATDAPGTPHPIIE